ncbi:MAG: hypothetical protein AMK69_22265 [Nitrospira bacterium SG8_3]|nr:MAG: hypothetical protein AMK69_22265 [Nitrospira bacterium SG8_3]
MQTNGTVIDGLRVPTFSEIWEAVKDWANRSLTSERKAEAALTTGTLVLLGYVAFILHRGLENSTIVGTLPF